MEAGGDEDADAAIAAASRLQKLEAHTLMIDRVRIQKAMVQEMILPGARCLASIEAASVSSMTSSIRPPTARRGMKEVDLGREDVMVLNHTSRTRRAF